MKTNQLIIAAIFFALGFILGYFQTGGWTGEGGGQEIDEQTKLILETPDPDSIVSSPLRVAGKARGTWFFEGSFPLELQTKSGQSLATGIAQSSGEWMTEDFV